MVKNVLTLADIKPYLKPDFDTSDTVYLEALVSGVCDYVENYTNRPVTPDSDTGLVLTVADMVRYYKDTMPHLKEMKNDDMGLVFTTTLPDTLTRRLTVYRRLRW